MVFSQGLATVLVLVLSLLTYIVSKGWKQRRMFHRLRAQGMPMPPWNPITGHLLSFLPLLKLFPKDAINNYILGELCKPYTKSDRLIYLDLWPLNTPLLMVSSPELAIQACEQHDLPKPYILKPFFEHFAGKDNMFTENGPEWKRSRSMFAPGFNPRYLMGQMNHIIEEATIFVDILRKHARSGEMLSLDKATCNFTMDIIGLVCFNSRLSSQTTNNVLASAMRSQIEWRCLDGELNPFQRWHPIRPFVQWYNSYKMNKYIGEELDKRFAERQGGKIDNSSRSIIDLVLQNYMAENPSTNAASGVDPAFKKWACIQMRLMIFVGHDSTAATICYCYYLLSKRPDAMARIRAEHDEVLGTDLSAVQALLQKEPERLNRLSYTNAVMKETLRMFAPGAGMRGGLPGVDLVDTHGNNYPTEGCDVWIVHSTIHRDPKNWVRPDDFLPERWLVGPEDPLYPMKGAYRPFEFGSRNCIGQSLVSQNVKTVLALTLREFEVRAAYDEWDKLHPNAGLKTAYGERAYQISIGAAHPADGFPCLITSRV